MYRVGKMTDFGTLLAEACKPDTVHETVSVYEMQDCSYLVIEWLESGQEEVQITRTYHNTRDEANQHFLRLAFGIEADTAAKSEIWDIPDETPEPDTSPKSPSWGPWGQDGRKGN